MPTPRKPKDATAAEKPARAPRKAVPKVATPAPEPTPIALDIETIVTAAEAPAFTTSDAATVTVTNTDSDTATTANPTPPPRIRKSNKPEAPLERRRYRALREITYLNRDGNPTTIGAGAVFSTDGEYPPFDETAMRLIAEPVAAPEVEQPEGRFRARALREIHFTTRDGNAATIGAGARFGSDGCPPFDSESMALITDEPPAPAPTPEAPPRRPGPEAPPHRSLWKLPEGRVKYRALREIRFVNQDGNVSVIGANAVFHSDGYPPYDPAAMEIITE